MDIKKMIEIFIIFLGVSCLSFILPWWNIVLVPCFVFLFSKSNRSLKKSFLYGFIATTAFWGSLLFYLHFTAEGNLATRFSKTFSIPHPFLLYILIILIGGLLGGLGASSGASLKEMTKKKK